MATVRFSEQLRNNIINAARRKMTPAVEKAQEASPDDSWGIIIYNRLFAADLTTINTLPSNWFHHTSHITIDKVGDIDVDLQFRFAQEMPWPHHIVDSDIARGTVRYGSRAVILKDHEVWADFKQEVETYKARLQEAAKRRTEFVDMVRELVHAYSTLAPALKAWPALWELVPESVKEKHREVKVKQKKEVELNVDVNKLTAMSAAAKFGV